MIGNVWYLVRNMGLPTGVPSYSPSAPYPKQNRYCLHVTLNSSESIWPPPFSTGVFQMRSLHRRGRETKKFLFLSSSRLCLMGWGSSFLEILQVFSWADPGSSQLGTPVAKRQIGKYLRSAQGRFPLPHNSSIVGPQLRLKKWFTTADTKKMAAWIKKSLIWTYDKKPAGCYKWKSNDLDF